MDDHDTQDNYNDQDNYDDHDNNDYQDNNDDNDDHGGFQGQKVIRGLAAVQIAHYRLISSPRGGISPWL